MTEFTVVAHNLEFPYGTRCTYKPCFPLREGRLYLLTVGALLTIGRYYRDIAGCDWIIQPDLIIRVDGRVVVEIWGLATPIARIDQATWPALPIAAAVVLEICKLVAPLSA